MLTTPRWEVQVLNPIDGKPKVWDTYAVRDRAESVAGTLRQHGFWCQVHRVDDGDERHAGDAPEVQQ